MTVRTRFAPSPTGRLHLGNLRIAAFNWLFARHHGGVFILRIEDTDVERNQEGSEETICEDLRWLGLDWDEGPQVGGPHAPYRQSERGAVYQKATAQLLSAGKAYRCWCTEEELQESREQVSWGEVTRYSGRCRRLSGEEQARNAAEGRPSVVRFAVPEGPATVQVDDEIRGTISFPRNDLTDFVIQRANGTATYNFAVVADDIEMEITHVIRHVGHLANTPKQALLFDALGQPRPRFAHIPTVLAPEGGKLSKRTGAQGADQLAQAGYNPDGVLNYMSLLGWSSEDEREVLTRQELIERISLDRVGKSDTTYDPEKLRWLSGQHIARLSPEAFVDAAIPFVDRRRIPLEGEALRIALLTIRTRVVTFGQVNEHLERFFPPRSDEWEAARAAVRQDSTARGVLENLGRRLGSLATWSAPSLAEAVKETGRETGAKGPALYHPLRRALTGDESGPDLAGIMAALGREEVEARIRATLDGQ
jgi:nondiscriminating glutamyl-tRNA synthetase